MFYTLSIIDQIKNNLWENRVTTCSRQKGRGTRTTRIYNNTNNNLPPDLSSLKMKILQASFVSHCMSNCLRVEICEEPVGANLEIPLRKVLYLVLIMLLVNLGRLMNPVRLKDQGQLMNLKLLNLRKLT